MEARLACLCASCVPLCLLCALCLYDLSGFGPLVHDELNLGSKPAASAPPIQQEIDARPWEPSDLHVDDVTVLLALQKKTIA